LSLTHISTIRGKSSFEAVRLRVRFRLPYSYSALRSEDGWFSSCSRLFPGLQTTEGISSAACPVRLRRGRRLSLSSITATSFTTHGRATRYPRVSRPVPWRVSRRCHPEKAWVRAGMIVGCNNGRGHTLDGRLEDLRHAHLGRIHRPVINLYDVQHVIAIVQQDDLQVCRVGGWRGTSPSFSNRPPPNRT